ncbi:hypothetical protein SEA_CAMERICO_59 [Gordonia phage Camerico]|nr:hypothetical protein SEA_CAMERICO_59 [Gordonia phage Camerico]
MAQEFTKEQAEDDLFTSGPGSICEDCGHFAHRHEGSNCHFPRPEDNPCRCGGMLWQGQKVDMSEVINPSRVKAAGS